MIFLSSAKYFHPTATPTLWSKMQCHNNNADCVEIVFNFWVKSNNELSLTDSRKKREIRGLGTIRTWDSEYGMLSVCLLISAFSRTYATEIVRRGIAFSMQG